MAVWLRQHQQSLVVLLICSITVGVAWHRAARTASARHEEKIEAATSTITREIHGRFEKYGRILHIARALFDALPAIAKG